MSNWLARRLQELFSRPGLTVHKVAAETGVPRSYISLMKTGRQIPSEEVVRKLARYFGEDEEEWAFQAKGLPVFQDLKQKYPNELPKYARRTLGDEPGTEPPSKERYQVTFDTYKVTHEGREALRPAWQPGEFIPISRIETYANDSLRLFAERVGHEITFPLDAESLVGDVFNLEVFYDDGQFMDRLGDGLLGCLYPDGMPCPPTGSDRVIVVNEAARFRWVTTAFTILHELGHFLLHFPKDAVASVDASYCRSSEVQPSGKTRVPPREWQASRFAAEVLMPKGRVQWLLDGKPPGANEIINLDNYGTQFRQYFGVSQAAMEKRLSDLAYKCAYGRYAYANVTNVD